MTYARAHTYNNNKSSSSNSYNLLLFLLFLLDLVTYVLENIKHLFWNDFDCCNSCLLKATLAETILKWRWQKEKKMLEKYIFKIKEKRTNEYSKLLEVKKKKKKKNQGNQIHFVQIQSLENNEHTNWRKKKPMKTKVNLLEASLVVFPLIDRAPK